MNWLQKCCATIPVENMLDHAIKAVTMTMPGSWKVVENRPNLKKTYRLQGYGAAILHGKDIYQPGDEFLVKIFAKVKRGFQDIPEEIYYDPEASEQWMRETTVPVSDFDSTSGHNLVHYHGIVAGFIPGRNWSHKEQVTWWSHGVNNPMYEIGNSQGDRAWGGEKDEEPFFTPFDLAEWVRDTIEKGYQDFGNDGDDNSPISPQPDQGDLFPEWPYSEDEYAEEHSNVLAPRVRGIE